MQPRFQHFQSLKVVLCMLFFHVPGYVCRYHCNPTGSIHCRYISRYGGYQWATCRTNTYIKTKSKGSHACIDSLAKTCYYQCMIDVHNKNSGSIRPDCECSLNDPKPTEIPLADWCHSPSGKECNWYRECLNKAYPECEDDKDEYAITFAEKFCKLYSERFHVFSENGTKWVNAVRKCLQVQLVPTLDKYRKKTCKELKNKAFETHTPCYLHPDGSSISICDLNPIDKWQVFWTIKGSFLSSFSASGKGFLEVGDGCFSRVEEYRKIKEGIINAVKKIINLKEKIHQMIKMTVEQLKYESVYLILTLYRKFSSLRIKRSLIDEDDLKKSQMAGKIIDALAIQENWKDESIVWFAYANNDNHTTTGDPTTMMIHVLLDDANKYNSSLNPANITNTLITMADRILQGTYRVEMDNDTIEVEGIKGCLDRECEIFGFNVSTTTSYTTSNTISYPTPTKETNKAINLNGTKHDILMIFIICSLWIVKGEYNLM